MKIHRLAIWVCLVGLVGCSSMPGLKTRVAARVLDLDQPRYAVVVDRDIAIPMRDGVRLRADIYRPRAQGRFPVVVVRTPYDKHEIKTKQSFVGELFASQGLIYLVQDTRGKYTSEGTYYPYIHEALDGQDTFAWAGTQPWSSGRIGTFGFSYFGSTQWLSAPLKSPYLKAMVPVVTSQDVYPRWMYYGIMRLIDVLDWHYTNAPRQARNHALVDWDKAVWHLPLIEADNALGQDVPSYNDWIIHSTPDAYWDRIRVDDKVDQIQAPALLIAGWYDYYLDLMLEDFSRMRTQGGSPEARQSRIIIGPWTHETKSAFEAMDFGREASFMRQISAIVAWYRSWLGNNTPDSGPPVKIFVMGLNQWRAEQTWPLARTRYEKYYLHSAGRANTAAGDGTLSRSEPGQESADHFTYDPANPVPSVGGTSIYGNIKPGPQDQKTVENRPDVLVYTTPVLTQDTEVTGPVRLILHASSSAPDTDFVAKLVDVYPDGKAVNIKDGVIRARYRNSLSNPSFLEPGQVYPFEIKIGATSNLFKKGHRIRLQVTSSHFPEFSRNQNTKAAFGMTAEIAKAEQVIYHEQMHASHLILPIIPAAR